MNTGLDQYMDIFKDAVEDSAAKLTISFEKILIKVIILFMVIPRKINFTQMGRYVSLAKRFFGKQGRWAIAIDPSYISKAGKKKLFFSPDTSLSGEEVLLYYRTRFHIEFCFQCFVHITKCCQGNYEGDGNGIFYVFIQVTDDQYLSGETNFLSKWVHPEPNFN